MAQSQDHSLHEFNKVSVGFEMVESGISALNRQVTVYSCTCGEEVRFYREASLTEELPQKFTSQLE